MSRRVHEGTLVGTRRKSGMMLMLMFPRIYAGATGAGGRYMFIFMKGGKRVMRRRIGVGRRSFMI